jgi:hypothetical protein
MTQLYEVFYGIHNHIEDKSPFSAIKMHKAENTIDHSLYDLYARLHIVKGIYSKTGLTLEGMLDLPKYKISHLLKIVDEIDKQKMAAEKSALDDLEKSKAK